MIAGFHKEKIKLEENIFFYAMFFICMRNDFFFKRTKEQFKEEKYLNVTVIKMNLKGKEQVEGRK